MYLYILEWLCVWPCGIKEIKETRFVYGFRTEFHLSVWDSANYRTILCTCYCCDGVRRYLWKWAAVGPLCPSPSWYMSVYGADFEWYRHRRTEDLGGNPISVPLCSLQIAHNVTWARLWALFRNRQVTTWATTRPILWTISRGHFLRREYGYTMAEAVSVRPLTSRGTGSRPCQSMYVCIAVDFLWVLRFSPVSIIPPVVLMCHVGDEFRVR
jgi:hypothetical protein